MNHLFTLITSQLGNQIVGGGLVLMFTGSIIALARNVPLKMCAWIKRRTTFEVEIPSTDPLFSYVSRWLDSQPYSRRARRLSATTEFQREDIPSLLDGSSKKKRSPPRIIYSPSPGSHIFIYGGNIIFLRRDRETTRSPGRADSGAATSKQEFYYITTIGHNQHVIRDLIGEIVESGSPKDDSINIWRSSFDYWKCAGILKPRKIDSVILNGGIVESIMSDAKSFLGKEDWYRDVGIPWHRGYLLHGVPGSGKTSLVCALAGELGMDLYVMNVSGGGMNDEKLASLMGDVRPGAIVLMEDVDCTFPDREGSKDAANTLGGKVTLSGLLNVLDGVQSQEGCIVFMTTNNREKLDAAIVRPGRVDVEIEFGHATSEQILRLRDRLNPSAKDDQRLLAACSGMTMAEVQKYLLDKEKDNGATGSEEASRAGEHHALGAAD